MVSITEALAEIKLIDKKLASKTSTVLGNLSRPKHIADPLGEAPAFLQAELQSIADLRTRRIAIRSRIATANLVNVITVDGETQSIFDWLTWKREVALAEIALYQNIHTRIQADQARTKTQPQIYKDEKEQTHLVEIVFNLNYADFLKKHEDAQAKLDKLDGLLSLKNATIQVEI